MSSKTIYLGVDEFVEKRTIEPSGWECKIDNVVFRKGDTVEHFRVKEILDTCKKYNQLNISTLVIKSKNHLTIWIEKKFKQPSDLSEESPTKVSPPSNNNKDLPTTTVTRRYRGQVYEETVIDWAAVKKVQQNKPRRKYRGQYVD